MNEQVQLMSLHTLFAREHNRIVGILQRINRCWSPERLYQEARKINIARWQVGLGTGSHYVVISLCKYIMYLI